jgi:hypothetical protein
MIARAPPEARTRRGTGTALEGLFELESEQLPSPANWIETSSFERFQDLVDSFDEPVAQVRTSLRISERSRPGLLRELQTNTLISGELLGDQSQPPG